MKSFPFPGFNLGDRKPEPEVSLLQAHHPSVWVHTASGKTLPSPSGSGHGDTPLRLGGIKGALSLSDLLLVARFTFGFLGLALGVGISHPFRRRSRLHE
jgi:hypothetical protein